jgi:hypothetical protein
MVPALLRDMLIMHSRKPFVGMLAPLTADALGG